MHIPSASSKIKTVKIRFQEPDSDSDSDSQPRVKQYYAPSPLCDSPQTLKLRLSIGTRYPREEAFASTTRFLKNLLQERYPRRQAYDPFCILFLEDLGYLPKPAGDYGRRKIRSAIKRFQLNHGLEATGVLDFPTVEAITERRCSQSDIVDGVNTTRLHNPTSDGPSCFALFPGAPKWDKFDLSYSFEANVPRGAKNPFRRAFAEWAQRTRFTFSEKPAGGDIVIGFYKGRHGVDCAAFNGPGGSVAHAFKPCDGRLHVDMNQKWSFLSNKHDSIDMETTALHELGHVLGLSHSSDKEAVMYPCVKPGQVKHRLTHDDILGINCLYWD